MERKAMQKINLQKRLRITLGGLGSLDEDEIESFLPFDVCAERGCHIHLNSEDTGRELFRAKYYCESCYSKRRASCIIDSMSQKDAYGVTEAISIF